MTLHRSSNESDIDRPSSMGWSYLQEIDAVSRIFIALFFLCICNYFSAKIGFAPLCPSMKLLTRGRHSALGIFHLNFSYLPKQGRFKTKNIFRKRTSQDSHILFRLRNIKNLYSAFLIIEIFFAVSFSFISRVSSRNRLHFLIKFVFICPVTFLNASESVALWPVYTN